MINDLGEKTAYFKALTGVRAVAAYMVFFHHFNISPVRFPVHRFIDELHVGVTIFFVLSGFLIAYRYLDLTDISFRNYIVNRFARIYPVYSILTLLTFWLQGGLGENLFLLGLNLSFLRGLSNIYKFTGIGQGWSLTVEESFYFMALLFFALIRFNRYYLIALPALLLTSGVGLVLIFTRFPIGGIFCSFEFMFNYTFPGRCCEFFIGIALAILIKKKYDFSFNRFTYSGIAGIILCIYLISLFRGNFDFGIRHPAGKIINTLILPIAGIGPLFYGLIRENTIISNILGSRLFVLLGKSSYVFYLIHMGIIPSLFPVFFPEQKLLSFILHFLVLNILSILIYRLIEEPLNTFIRRLNAKWQ